MTLKLVFLFTALFVQSLEAQFTYDWPIKPGFITNKADILYSAHAASRNYVVYIPTDESDCFERVQIGSGHDNSHRTEPPLIANLMRVVYPASLQVWLFNEFYTVFLCTLGG